MPSAPSPLKINSQRTDVKAKLSPVFLMSLDMNNEVKRLFQTLSLRFVFSITQILSNILQLHILPYFLFYSYYLFENLNLIVFYYKEKRGMTHASKDLFHLTLSQLLTAFSDRSKHGYGWSYPERRRLLEA